MGPSPECDLVLRGGVTSGIVYPRALVELARTFRFRDIGGASAGAIAAGVAAAAEFGRQTGLNPGAFDETIAAIPEEVGGARAAHAGTSFRRLFQAEPRVAPLERALWDWLPAGSPFRFLLARLGDLLGGVWLAAAVAMLALAVGMIVAVLTALMAAKGVLLGALLLLLLLLLLALPVFGVILPLLLYARLRFWRNGIVANFRRNGFGLCNGTTRSLWEEPASEPTSPEAKAQAVLAGGALADWLHLKIQQAAGLWEGGKRPLTIGDLWCGRLRDGKEAEPGQLAWCTDRAIDLVLTATNLSHQVPHRFPFLEPPGLRLYFQADELKRVLPAPVVEWMVEASEATAEFHRRAGRTDLAELAQITREGLVFHRLPHPEDLPVLLGVRMSLSFPFLLSAVPLHALVCDDTSGAAGERDANGTPVLRPCLFSDGGITSNFPVTLFDGIIPTRPTLCINLADAAPGQTLGDGPEDRVELDLQTRTADRFARTAPEWRVDLGADGLGAFAMAIVDTARNAHENLLMTMATCRPRIATVRLNPDREGGLNLDMTPDRIAFLGEIGRAAGKALVDSWGPGSPDAWAEHRAIRLRTALAAFETALARLAREKAALDAGGTPVAETLDRVIEGLAGATDAERDAARWLANDLLGLAACFGGAANRPDRSLYDGARGSDPTALNRNGQAPRPRMGLRLVPTGSQDPLQG